MAFRSMQETLKPLLFLCCLNILSDKKTVAVNIREKCMCIREANSVPWRSIKDFNVFESGTSCKKVQIIINLGHKLVCLVPNSTQGKMLQKCWKRINFHEKNKKNCLLSGKVKKSKKRPKTM